MTEQEKVLGWLENQGYPFELEIGQLFRSAGWHVRHGEWYLDPVSRKARAIDLRAILFSKDPNGSSAVGLELVVECKRTGSKPWVVFAAPAERHPAVLDAMMSSDPLTSQVFWTARNHKLARPRLLSLKDQSIAHGVVRAFFDGKNGDPTGPWAAIQGVAGASYVLGLETAKWAAQVKSRHRATITVPVIVLDGPLYQYSVSTGGDAELAPAVRSHVATTLDGTGDVCVAVLTRAGVGDVIGSTNTELLPFLSGLVDHAEDIMREFRSEIESNPAMKHLLLG